MGDELRKAFQLSDLSANKCAEILGIKSRQNFYNLMNKEAIKEEYVLALRKTKLPEFMALYDTYIDSFNERHQIKHSAITLPENNTGKDIEKQMLKERVKDLEEMVKLYKEKIKFLEGKNQT